jgi:hypothetical protein
MKRWAAILFAAVTTGLFAPAAHAEVGVNAMPSEVDPPAASAALVIVFHYDHGHGMALSKTGAPLGMRPLPVKRGDTPGEVRKVFDFFARPAVAFTLSDAAFPVIDPQNSAPDDDAFMLAAKTRWLAAIREHMKALPGPKYVLYSGHGGRCVDPATRELHWCLALPLHPDSSRSDYGLDGLVKTTAPYMVSDADLYEATGAQFFFLNSCETGAARVFFEKQNREFGADITMIASSLSNGPTSEIFDGDVLVAKLSAIRDEMAYYTQQESRNPDEQLKRNFICTLDWDRPGWITYRQLLLLLQVSRLNLDMGDTPNAISFSDISRPSYLGPYVAKLFGTDADAHVDYREPESAASQNIITGIVSDKAFVRLPAGCASDPRAERRTDSANQIRQIADLIGKYNRALTFSSQDDAEIAFRTTDKRDHSTDLLLSARRQVDTMTPSALTETFGYLRDWVGPGQRQALVCRIDPAGASQRRCAETDR